MQRFYNPVGGNILVDDVPIQNYNLKWLRSQVFQLLTVLTFLTCLWKLFWQIGYVGQEPILFSGTIAENIAFGSEGVSNSDIEKAAKLANAHNFIISFPGIGKKNIYILLLLFILVIISRAIILLTRWLQYSSWRTWGQIVRRSKAAHCDCEVKF